MKDSNGDPISGVTIETGVGHSATTDSNGEYTVGRLPEGTYILTPSKDGYMFSPVSHTFSVPPDVSEANFQGRATTTVSGQVTDADGDPVAGVTLLASTGQSTVTDSNGEFALPALDLPSLELIKRGHYFVFNEENQKFIGYDKPPIVLAHGIWGGPTLFVAQWESGSAVVTLVDPDGRPIDPAFASEHPDLVIYEADETTALYYFTNAISGEWQLLLEGESNIPAEGSNCTAFAAFESSLILTATTDKDWYVPGDRSDHRLVLRIAG